jgi:hypothetical protein
LSTSSILRCRESLGTAPIRRSLKQADPDAAQHVFGQADLLQLNNITLDHRQNIPAAAHLLAPDDNFGLGGQLLQMDKVLWFGITGFLNKICPICRIWVCRAAAGSEAPLRSAATC